MAKKKKRKYWIQGDYGNGWENVVACEDYEDDPIRTVRERKQLFREYLENEPQYPHRLTYHLEEVGDE